MYDLTEKQTFTFNSHAYHYYFCFHLSFDIFGVKAESTEYCFKIVKK